MIFQASIDLELKDKTVHAVVDFDTGVIGFTELLREQYIEYNFFNSPNEYRTALFGKLESLFVVENFKNLQICRKSESAEVLRKSFMNSKQS